MFSWSCKNYSCPQAHLHSKSLSSGPLKLVCTFPLSYKYSQKLEVWFICCLRTRWPRLFTPQIHQLTCAVLPCGIGENSSLTLSTFRLQPCHYFSMCSYTFYYWSQNYSSPFSNPAILFDSMTSSGSWSQRQFSAFAKTLTECLMSKDENTLSRLWCLKRGERPQDLSAYYTV